MLDLVAQDPTKTCRQVYDEIVLSVPPNKRESIPAYDNVRTVLNRRRTREIPPVPHSINEVDIQGRWKRTVDGRRFLSHHDNHWGIAVFTTADSLRCLGDCNDVYLDGTFKSTPCPYTQFMTIHGFYMDRVVPFVFVLMQNRTIGHYRQVFAHIKRRYQRITNANLAPNNIVVDFELGMITAVETEFPQSSIRGCFFHFCQSIWRRVQQEGLARHYDRNRYLKDLIRKLMAIAFLPSLLVRNSFQQFLQQNLTRLLCRRYPELQNLLQYFTRNYLNGQFRIAIWNVYDRDMDNRTNNHVECKSDF